MQDSERKDRVYEAMNAAYVTSREKTVVTSSGKVHAWVFDFRPLLLKSGLLDDICHLFWKEIGDPDDIQFGGLETAAITLVSGMLLKGTQRGKEVNGFYIRKSRRKDGFQKSIEGTVTGEKIMIVDDALNSGKSIMRQIKALEDEGHTISGICVMIRFRSLDFYKEFTDRGIQIYSLFTLEDFPQVGSLLTELRSDKTPSPSTPFDIHWKFESDKPVYYHVLPKSAPVLDDDRMYFGADNGTLWALNQSDGSIAWQFKTLFGAGQKRIFSSPAVQDNTVYFGAYDGNFYALDAVTGKKRWVYMDADWIGSSPKVAPDLGLVFIGLEFGLWNKQGGIAALDSTTGEKKWWREVPTYVHSSPAYLPVRGIVIVGSSSGEVFAFSARTGDSVWTFKAADSVKASFAYDETRNMVIFGSFDKHLYALNAETGALIWKIETLEPIYSTPVIDGDSLYAGILDKRILRIDTATGRIIWEFWTHSRVFADPLIIDDVVYVGSNDGRFYALNKIDGSLRGYLQTSERIVNKAAYNARAKRFFVPTYANQIYAISWKSQL